MFANPISKHAPKKENYGHLREWAIFQLYHGGKKITLQWDDDDVYNVLDQQTSLVF